MNLLYSKEQLDYLTVTLSSARSDGELVMIVQNVS